MNKQNLALLAEGHKLIALAYAREAGVELDATTTAVTNEEVVTETAKPTVKPNATKNEVTPLPEPEDVDADEGYTLEELNGMTVKQLKEIASENDIAIPKDTKKADIIDIIMEGDEDADESTQTEETESVEADETEATTGDAEEDYEELTIADVEAMTLADLKTLAKEYEVDLPKNAKKDKAIEEIVKALFEQDEIDAYYTDEAEATEEEAEAEAEGEELSPEDLDEMSLAELKALATEYEVEFPKLIKADKLRALLVEALFVEDEGEGEDDSTDLDETDLAEEYGLNDMSVEELTDLLVEHEIKAKGKKEALIAKVLEAIEEGIIEVGDEEEGE